MPEKFTDAPLLTKQFDDALHLATEHHRSHLRKGTDVPYVAHLLAVASLVLEMGGDEDEAIGGLLHDAVEDGGGPPMLARIRDEYGPGVADIVAANTDTDVIPKPPWRQRKEDYIAGIGRKSPAAVRVSLADKLHNARSIVRDMELVGEDLWSRFSADRDAVCWYYDALADAFATRADELGSGATVALGELRRLVDAMSGTRA